MINVPLFTQIYPIPLSLWDASKEIYFDKYDPVRPINNCLRLILNLSINSKLEIFYLLKQNKFKINYQTIFLVYHWTVRNVPAMCHMPHAAFFMNIPQKPLKGTTLKSIPKLPIWILSQILKTFSQSEANSFGWSMASNNWKACAFNILKHRKKTFRPSVNWHFLLPKYLLGQFRPFFRVKGKIRLLPSSNKYFYHVPSGNVASI